MTEWWAFKPITTAFEKTKKLLLEPFNIWTWIKLIVIVFFVGTGANRLTSPFSNLSNMGQYRTGNYGDASSVVNNILSNSTLLLIILAAMILLIVFVIILAYLRNVFSFVLIKALATGDVHVIKPAMDNLGRGFRLFIFSLVLGLITLIVDVILVVLAIIALIAAIKIGVGSAAGIVAVILLACVIVFLLLLLVVFSILMGIVIGFTYDFVAPMVLFKNMGVLEAWRSLWGTIRKEWQQFGVYVITRWLLELGIGIAAAIITFPLLLIFAAILLVGVFAAAAAWKASAVIAVFIILTLILVAVALIIVMMFINMPIAVYLRYYSLDVLKKIDPSAVQYTGKIGEQPPVA